MSEGADRETPSDKWVVLAPTRMPANGSIKFMAVGEDSQWVRNRHLAGIAGVLVLAGMVLALPASGAIESLSTAIRLGWPLQPEDGSIAVSVQEALTKTAFWTLPCFLVAAIAGVVSGTQSRKPALPALVIGVAAFVLVIAIATALGAAIL
jgi:hypothetical protein